jgi:AGZA family xanthine/uracil permease-like MFS transporter
MTEFASTLRRSGIDRYFRFTENGTTLWRDTIAGATTFIVMSYIIFVNPAILSFAGVEALEGTGLPFDGVLASTCLVAGVMSIVMGLVTNRAYAIAPGLGLNAVVAFTLVAGEGLGFPEAMGIVVMEGLLVTVLVLIGMRERVMQAIPLELKKAIAIGIGLFIAFIGLVNSGLVVRGEGTPVTLADFTTWPIFVVIVGLVITITLRAIGFRGDLLVAIILTTVIATIVNWATDYTAFTTPGVARWPEDIAQSPNFGLVGEFSFDAFATIGVITTIALVFSLFLADFFDTMGTLVGVGKQAGYLTKDGELPEIRKPLLVDSLAAVAGGAASSSSATTYIESGAGVGVGGRTGWVAVVAGALFFPFMFFAPLIGMVPAQATAPALIIVGWLMITALTESEERAERGGTVDRKIAGIDFHDFAIGLSAALTIMIMPFTYSITNGIGFGFIAYVVIRIAQGELRRIHPLMYAAAGAFALYFLIPLLHDNLSWI